VIKKISYATSHLGCLVASVTFTWSMWHGQCQDWKLWLIYMATVGGMHYLLEKLPNIGSTDAE
jgi:hypothetical protein